MVTSDAIRETQLFFGLDEKDCESLAQLGTARDLTDDTLIIEEGQPGESVYILASGSVRVEKGTIEKQQEMLASLEEGECFGEMALIDREPRSASVRASGDVKVISFRCTDLEAFFSSRPAAHTIILSNLARILSLRLRRVNESFIQNIYDSVIVIDRNYKILRWSKSTERDYFIDAKTAINRSIFVLLPELLEEGLGSCIRRVMDTGEVLHAQTEYRVDNGAQVFMESTLAPYLEDGAVTGVVIVNRNITELKRLEEELIKSERLAAVGEMAAEIGHDLNNYLSIVSGHAYLLSMHIENRAYDRVARSAGMITEQVEKMEKFTAGLLESARQESETSECDLNELITKSIDFVKFWKRFKGIEFRTQFDSRLPALEIDPNQIQRVLVNLYSNAADAMTGSQSASLSRSRVHAAADRPVDSSGVADVKAAGTAPTESEDSNSGAGETAGALVGGRRAVEFSGGVRGVITTVTRLGDSAESVEFVVTDTGPGIPPENLAKLFEPGFTTRRDGHGFGLAICYRIVRNHRGSIQVESRPGEGTTFRISLPMGQR